MARRIRYISVSKDEPCLKLDRTSAVTIGQRVRTNDGLPVGTVTEVTGSGFRVIGRGFIGWLHHDAVGSVESFITVLECDTAGLADYEYDGESLRQNEAFRVIGAGP